MLKSVFKTVTFKQSQITIIGTLINGSLGALFYISLARFLGPANFGLLTVSITVLTLIADSVDFGTNTGLIRYVSANINTDRSKALKFLKLSLEFKIAVSILVLFIGLLSSPTIATVIFNKPELINPLRLVMIGVGGALLLSFATSSLQAFQKYFIWSLINISTNFLRLFLVIILILLGRLDLSGGLLSFIILPFFGFSLALLFIPFKQMLKTRDEFSVAGKLFKYNFWVGIFTIIAAVSARLDTFLTARLLSSSEVGIYGAANQLVQVVPQLVSALGIVAAPKFAGFLSDKDMTAYLKKFQLLVLGLAGLGLFAIPFSIYLIPQIFGVEYREAILPFIILLFAMLVFLISTPVHISVIYYFGKPDVFVWVSVGHLLITGILGFFLISSLGVIGAATTVLIGTTFNFLIPLGWLLIRMKK